MNLKKFLSMFFMIFALSFVFAENFSPVEITENKDGLSTVIIKSTIAKVDVYINETYYGKSTMEISEMNPGTYTLTLKKDGYEKEEGLIEVKKGYTVKYDIPLRLIYGSIRIENLPKDSVVQIDSFSGKDNYIIKTEGETFEEQYVPGNYAVRICRAGYDDVYKNIEVKPYASTKVEYEFEEKDVQISDFRVNKSVINPKYYNAKGKFYFSFVVTEVAPVRAYVLDSADNLVWNTEWMYFVGKNQGFFWNGRDNNGLVLPDGEYKVVVENEHYRYGLVVTLDSTLNYAVFGQTAAGAGVGDVPVLYAERAGSFSPFISCTPVMKFEGNDAAFYDLKSTAGFIAKFGNRSEFAMSGSINPLYSEENFGCFNTSFKLYNVSDLNNFAKLAYGGLVRYGVSGKDYNGMQGMDTGNGLGAGALINLDLYYIGAGYSAQFIYGAKNGKFEKDDMILRNTLNTFLRFGTFSKVSSWVSLDTYFSSSTKAASGLSAGMDYSLLLDGADTGLNLFTRYSTNFNSTHYLSQGIGLFYLF